MQILILININRNITNLKRCGANTFPETIYYTHMVYVHFIVVRWYSKTFNIVLKLQKSQRTLI